MAINRILENSTSFKNCISDLKDLFWIIKFSSSEQKNQIITYICNTPDEYKRLIRTSADLKRLAMYFSEDLINLEGCCDEWQLKSKSHIK